MPHSVSALPSFVKPLTHDLMRSIGKLNYMKTRKPPSEFARERGRLIQRARIDAELSQAQLAEKLGLKSREIISQYESGSIERIGERTCMGLVAILGMKPQDLAEDASMFQFKDELPTMSNEARRLARRWDGLPDDLRKLIMHTIDGFENVSQAKAKSARHVRKKTKP